jgi:hypothetical protein
MTAWSVEDCLDPKIAQPLGPKPKSKSKPEPEPEPKPINLSGDNASRYRLVGALVRWLMEQNIVVWEDGLDSMWDKKRERWLDGPRDGPRYGPGLGPRGKLNRGKVRLCSVMPVTSVKTHRVFLSVWFNRVLNSRVFVLCSLSLPVTHLAERES